MNEYYYYQDSSYLHVIRFYEDGTVIGVSTTEPVKHLSIISTWFNKESARNRHSIGFYEITDDSKILFNLRSTQGIVDYIGIIAGKNEIIFQIHSHINDSKYERIFSRYNKIWI
jgi:hypothetical protein